MFADSYPELVGVQRKVSIVAEDPDDDRVLEVAVSSGSKVVVSYDQHLLSLGIFEGIKKIHPKEFLKKFL